MEFIKTDYGKYCNHNGYDIFYSSYSDLYNITKIVNDKSQSIAVRVTETEMKEIIKDNNGI